MNLDFCHGLLTGRKRRHARVFRPIGRQRRLHERDRRHRLASLNLHPRHCFPQPRCPPPATHPSERDMRKNRSALVANSHSASAVSIRSRHADHAPPSSATPAQATRTGPRGGKHPAPDKRSSRTPQSASTLSNTATISGTRPSITSPRNFKVRCKFSSSTQRTSRSNAPSRCWASKSTARSFADNSTATNSRSPDRRKRVPTSCTPRTVQSFAGPHSGPYQPPQSRRVRTADPPRFCNS
jgi:hypothetical protein